MFSKKKSIFIIFLWGMIILFCPHSAYADMGEITVTVTVVSLQAPRVLKEADKLQAKKGEIVTYTIKYDNDGPSVVEDFVIIDEIPTGTTYARDSAEINNQPHIGAKVLVEYWDGSLWRGANFDNLPDSKVQKIKWTFDKEISAQDNDEGDDTKDTCDSEFPDVDAGMVKFRVLVEMVIIK